MPIRQAAREGSKEIFFAVVSTSATLAIVFLPVIFLEGFVGSLFREFGIVVAGAVWISAFVSLTITPVLNVLLQVRTRVTVSLRADRTILSGDGVRLSPPPRPFLHRRWLAVGIVLACLALIFFIGRSLVKRAGAAGGQSSIRFPSAVPKSELWFHVAGGRGVRQLSD